MNWYYEKEGICQGPCPESEIVTLVRRKQIEAATLVWNPGLDEWDTVQKLKPEWLALPTDPEPAAKPASKQTVPKTEGPLPAVEPAATGNLPKPKAGLEKSASDKEAKPGLLGRLFGMGKKSK